MVNESVLMCHIHTCGHHTVTLLLSSHTFAHPLFTQTLTHWFAHCDDIWHHLLVLEGPHHVFTAACAPKACLHLVCHTHHTCGIMHGAGSRNNTSRRW